jgi:leucyl aminopeptidase
MMTGFQIQKIDFAALSTKVNADEISVLLSPSRGSSAELNSTIKTNSVASLQRSHHYMTIHAGFWAGKEKAWVAPVFNAAGASALERRWVFHDWAKSLQTMFACRKLVIYLDEGCGVEDVVRAEDLVTSFSQALFTGSKWESVRVFANNPEAVTAGDLHYPIRFEHQVEYRRWVNENPDVLTSIEIGDRLKDFANQYDCSFVTLEESALRDEHMNLLLAVGQGAKKSPARLHILTKNIESGAAPLALIGKGITFDSGGINLKPHESFVNCMKNDMGGAALMSQLFMAMVRAGTKKPLLLAIPACENAIDAASMKPGVVIKSRKGKSVIIEHTDAEGRLILADAMSYVWDRYKPSTVMTAATLTTASLRQFSNFFTPVHFADAQLRAAVTKAADTYGEAFTFWDPFLPFLGGNKTNAADLTNMGRLPSHASMGGGSNVAAHFLKEFAEGPYVHFDIFNSIWNWSGDYPGAHYGCTGAVFNSLWGVLTAQS